MKLPQEHLALVHAMIVQLVVQNRPKSRLDLNRGRFSGIMGGQFWSFLVTLFLYGHSEPLSLLGIYSVPKKVILEKAVAHL